ncbi:MAG: FMN-binding protein [Clostridia bacterium]|nr:FMN-binding protein [Clostridia bacterium]
MVLLCSLVIASLLVFCAKDFLRKHQGLCYVICLCISLAVVAVVWSGAAQGLSGFPLTLANVFLQGGLAGALFIYIMYAGAVPDKSILKRQVMPIRGILSIMASILTLGHNVAYGRNYFSLLFLDAASLRVNVLLAAICSVVMILITLPLFVTSFICIRKKMQPKKWKRLQRLAYVFYALMFIHVLLLNTTGARAGHVHNLINIALYSVLFLCYASMRLCRVAVKKGKEGWTSGIQILCSALMVCGLVLIFAPVSNGTVEETVSEAYQEPDHWTDGKYKGASMNGYNGRLTVSVNVEDGKIARVRLSGTVDDEEYVEKVKEQLLPAFAEKNTTNLDSISGATTTSDAVVEAVRNALEGAVPAE